MFWIKPKEKIKKNKVSKEPVRSRASADLVPYIMRAVRLPDNTAQDRNFVIFENRCRMGGVL